MNRRLEANELYTWIVPHIRVSPYFATLQPKLENCLVAILC